MKTIIALGFSLSFFTLILSSQAVDLEEAYKSPESFFKIYSTESNFSRKQIEANRDYHPEIARSLCQQDEMQIFEVERGLLHDWKKAWLTKNISDFDQLGNGAFNSASGFFPALKGKAKHEFDGITVREWNTNEPLTSIKDQLDRYSRLSDMDIGLIDYTAEFASRGSDARFSTFEGIVKIELRGYDRSNAKIMDRGQWRVQFVKNNANKWKIAQIKPIDGESLYSKKAPTFVESSKDIGLDKLPIFLRTEAIRRGGYALSIADINNDGINDILIGYRDGIGLYLGKKQGGYVDGLKGSGLEGLNYVKTAVFADFENRGIQDLVVTTLEPSKKLNTRGAGSVKFFKGDGSGHFKPVDVDFGKKREYLQPMPTAVADFNNDGFLDLYVGYPGARDFTEFSTRPEIRDPQGFYLNDRKGSFKDFTDQFQETSTKNLTHFYPHASMAIDFDQKNGVDLLVVDDRNNLSPAYVNDGHGHFTQSAESIGIGNFGYGMSVAAGDLNNDGITDLLMTNVNFNSAARAARACDRMWGIRLPHAEKGLRLFQGLGDGKFQETTDNSGFTEAIGQGAAGLTLIDYNNDGKMDIYLVNGLWSGNPEGEETSTLFSGMASDIKNPSLTHTLNSEDTVGFKEYLRKTVSGPNGDSDTTSKNYKGHPSLAGFQRNRLFHNNGDGTFTEVAFFEGVDSIYDGFIVGTIVNPNGKQDLILRNGDPASQDYLFPVVQYFRNESLDNHRAVDLTLEGSQSNHDAFGTYVIAKFKDHKQVQHLVANSGSLQNERVLHFGLGNAPDVSAMEVHWPSGRVQEFLDLKPGRYHLKEMSGMARGN